ncbi:HAD-IB family hydrolase [Clostridium thermarum]|uniref:HAD-IB family hydrolase n=1 Tax=Clostridium thermarum TaxID=1716543 RepID=UPI0013D7D81C|nr:HAD-IB family hydrolase [Clostridium thermarum]
MVRLGIFDIDYTITSKETLVEFYKFMLKKKPRLLKYLPSALGYGLLYVTKRIELKEAKQAFLSFVSGIHEDEMNELVSEFYEKRLCNIFYSDAIDMIKKLKAEGCLIYLISASAEFYLKEFYRIPEVDMVIGTRYKVNDKLHTCTMEGENCKGEEKVKRLMQVLQEKKLEIDFKNSYMFSDSLSDLPLLNLVGNPYLINFKKEHDSIKILNWK